MDGAPAVPVMLLPVRAMQLTARRQGRPRRVRPQRQAHCWNDVRVRGVGLAGAGVLARVWVNCRDDAVGLGGLGTPLFSLETACSVGLVFPACFCSKPSEPRRTFSPLAGTVFVAALYKHEAINVSTSRLQLRSN